MKKKPPNLVAEFRKKHIVEKLPDVLYHYTSIEGFKGIIDSKEIWATAANHLLNDPTEITHAKEIALGILRKRKSDFNGKETFYNNCKNAIENSDRSKDFQCICSFSEEGDLLSQWRAYCPKGGVSVGFSVPRISGNDKYLEIKDGSPHNNYYVHEVYIYKCIYDPKEQKEKINELINFSLKHADLHVAGFFLKMIQTFSYSFKHKSFEEEKEWRLCYFPEDYQLKYRTKHSMLIPYLPCSIVDNNDRSIIRKIIIGPSRDKENLEKSVSLYLKDSRISASVEFTDTPYQPQ